jgi:hypothetical protein
MGAVPSAAQWCTHLHEALEQQPYGDEKFRTLDRECKVHRAVCQVVAAHCGR